MSERSRVGWNGYVSIVHELRDAVIAGKILPGAFFPTERELCDRYGASRPTIRKSLDALIDLGWAYRVPNRGVAAGRGILPGSTRNIAVIHAGQPWFTPLLDLLRTGLAERSWTLVEMAGTPEYPMEEALEHAQAHDVAGAIVWPYRGFVDGTRIGRIVRQLPIVALDHDLGGADRVTFDHEAAADTAVTALLNQGRRRIAITGFCDMLPAMLAQYRGFLHALFRAGALAEPRNILPVSLSGMQAFDPLNLLRRLSDDDYPDGLLVFPAGIGDYTRRWIQESPRELGRDIDLALLGGTAVNEAMPTGTVQVSYDYKEMASLTLDLLEARINQPGRPPHMEVAAHRVVQTRDLAPGQRTLRK